MRPPHLRAAPWLGLLAGLLAASAAWAAPTTPAATGTPATPSQAAAPDHAPATGGGTTAAPTEATLQAKQVPLTPKMVEAFIASFPPLADLADELDERHPVPPTTDEEDEGPEYLLVDHLKNPEDLATIKKELAKYGFSSYAEWADVAHSVSIAAEAAEGPPKGPDDLDAQKKQALAAVAADSSLTPAQKAARSRDIEDQFAALRAFLPLPGNVEVVKPFLDRIRALGADEGE